MSSKFTKFLQWNKCLNQNHCILAIEHEMTAILLPRFHFAIPDFDFEITFNFD